MKPKIIADDETPEPEPEGFWGPVHAEVRRLAKLKSDDAAPERP